MKDIKAGDSVFFFRSRAEFPIVAKVTRITQNFVFVVIGDASAERKFRRNGSGIKWFDGRISAIQPGAIEKIEKEKQDKKRISEIIEQIAARGFKFTGYPQWFPIEQWEEIAKAINAKVDAPE